MTLRQLYDEIKNGAVYGYRAVYGIQRTIYTGFGHDGKGGFDEFIFFEHYGRTACRVSFEAFRNSFTLIWDSADEFLKDHYNITNQI